MLDPDTISHTDDGPDSPDGTQLLAQEAYVHKSQIDIQDWLDKAADVLSAIGIDFGQDLANASER